MTRISARRSALVILVLGISQLWFSFSIHSKLREQGGRRERKQETETPSIETTPSSVASGTLRQEEDQEERQQNDFRQDEQAHHLVFSTSCHAKQDWQSYLFFFQAMVQRQPGTVTRVVSGCTAYRQQKFQKIFEEQITAMEKTSRALNATTSFHLHFTPEFGRIGGDLWQKTKYWNKPFGVRHWMEHVLGYNTSDKNGAISFLPLGSNSHDNDIIILVDPDMILQKPILNNFSHVPNDFWNFPSRNSSGTAKTQVQQGLAIAQDYAYNSRWKNYVESNLTFILGNVTNKSSPSPVLTMTNQSAATFAAGPPYILTAYDFYRTAVVWSDILPRYFEVHQEFMAEMYTYSMAAAHFQIKHQLARGFMVSNVELPELEGWYFLSDTNLEQVCARNNIVNLQAFDQTIQNDVRISFENVSSVVNKPYVIHHCQRYSIGEYFYSKYKTHTNMFSCEEPLFELPPSDAAIRYNYSHYGDGSTVTIDPTKKNTLTYHKNSAYMICSILPELNNAAIFFKQHHCKDAVHVNYNRSWNFFRDFQVKQSNRPT